MARRILVPLDGSSTSEAVLPQAVRLARRTNSEVLLVRAELPIYMMEGYTPVFDSVPAASREYLAGVGEKLAAQGVRARVIDRVGAPGDVILRVAREQHVTLIAMATHGRSGLTRVLLGSVTEEVLRASPVPVYVLRPFPSYEIAQAGRPGDGRPMKILVPLDGSALQRAAVPQALKFAVLFHARVILLRVLGPVLKKATPTPADEEQIEEALRALREAAFQVSAAGVDCLTLLEEGEAAPRILSIAREHDVDLIAMATHGRRGISRLVFGSVTEKVLREAPVPMLVVNAGAFAPGKLRRGSRGAGRRNSPERIGGGGRI
ncbi:MAG TPA: universal stress protein [Planctomycetota bacterium]|nr:universal stress protein [Planctomycetota bacterium]